MGKKVVNFITYNTGMGVSIKMEPAAKLGRQLMFHALV
jgi:hypothetical protein